MRRGLPSGPRASTANASAYSARAGRCGRSRCRGRKGPRRRAGVAVADLGGLDGAVGGEVTAGDDATACLPASLAPVTSDAVRPRGVDEVAKPRPPGLRADVTLDQERGAREVLGLEHGRLGRVQRAPQPLEVDLAVPRHTDANSSHSRRAYAPEHDVLERVGGGRPSRPRCTVGQVDQRLDGRRVGVSWYLAAGSPSTRRRRRGEDRLDVGRVTHWDSRRRCPRRRRSRRGTPRDGGAAHRAGHGGARSCSRCRAGRRSDVGLAVRGRLVETLVVEVERVRVLHQELAAAQEACARPGLVAVLRLDLVERPESPCRSVFPLHRQVKSSSWVGPSR